MKLPLILFALLFSFSLVAKEISDFQIEGISIGDSLTDHFSEKEISNYYEEVAKISDKKLAATWMMGDLFAMLNDKGLNISKSPISAKNFAELIQSIKSGEISGRIAKEVFELMVESGDNPKKIIESKGMIQQSDPKELEKIINEILTKNKDKVDQYKSGKEKLFGFFVGQVMKQSGGKANPQLTNDILKKLLKG